MACMALFVMLPVLFFIILIYQDRQFPTDLDEHTVYMDCVSLAILVNESKYRPLIICFAESALFFFFIFSYEHVYDKI